MRDTALPINLCGCHASNEMSTVHAPPTRHVHMRASWLAAWARPPPQPHHGGELVGTLPRSPPKSPVAMQRIGGWRVARGEDVLVPHVAVREQCPTPC